MRLPTRGWKDGGPSAERGVPAKERFEHLFRENSRPLLGYALRRTEDPQDAADVVSEVMLVAWRRLDDVPSGPDSRLWLFGVARRVVANVDRSAARRLHLGQRLRETVSRFQVPDHAEGHPEREAVRTALGRLSPEDRELMLLVAWEGLEPHQAAKVMAISGAAARTRLHRARRRLQRELRTLGINDDPDSPSSLRLYPRTEEES